MAWVRIHDGALSHPKLVGLIDWKNPFCVWVWGLSYCQMHLTDGLIPKAAIPGNAAMKTARRLIDAGLWEAVDRGGFRVHDFLHWNDAKDLVENRQRLARHRKAFLDDPELRHTLRQRDQDLCRYCGIEVNWADRKGATGATYDHVDPKGAATIDNLVVACRGCNSRKRDRLPAAAGMVMLPVPEQPPSQLAPQIKPRSDLDTKSGFHPVTKPNQTKPESTKERARAEEPDNSEHPVARFMRVTYPQLYAKSRNGAAYRLNEARDFEVCQELVDTYGDRLTPMLEYFLNMPPAKDVLNQPGTPRQFKHMAPQVDAELRKHGR